MKENSSLKYNNKIREAGLPPGFTLIETLIVIVIVIVLTAIAIPSFKHIISSERLQADSYQIVQDLREVKADAIQYQQDLNVYFDYNNSPIQPLSGTNLNNREYSFEEFLYNSISSPPQHYIPTDSNNSHHFIKRTLKYGIIIKNISSTTSSSIPFSGKKYFTIEFRSGAENTFRGEADIVTSMSERIVPVPTATYTPSIGSTPVVITLKDPTTGSTFYVRISATGKISMNGAPTPD